MALNFKLHVNKVCFESLCISIIYLEGSKTVEMCLKTLGPFIREKIRRELDHLYEHVLFKTKTVA